MAPHLAPSGAAAKTRAFQVDSSFTPGERRLCLGRGRPRSLNRGPQRGAQRGGDCRSTGHGVAAPDCVRSRSSSQVGRSAPRRGARLRLTNASACAGTGSRSRLSLYALAIISPGTRRLHRRYRRLTPTSAPRRRPWCGAATCPARSSRFSSMPRTALLRGPRPGLASTRPRLSPIGRGCWPRAARPPAEPARAGSARLSNSHRSYAGGGIVPNLIFSAISGLLATSPDAGTCSLSRAPSNL
jgi:hypothetical protein